MNWAGSLRLARLSVIKFNAIRSASFLVRLRSGIWAPSARILLALAARSPASRLFIWSAFNPRITENTSSELRSTPVMLLNKLKYLMNLSFSSRFARPSSERPRASPKACFLERIKLGTLAARARIARTFVRKSPLSRFAF